MHWDKDKELRLQKYAAKSQERRLKRTKSLVRLFTVVVVLGLGLIVRDLLTRNSEPHIMIDFLNQKMTIADWEQSGFLKSLNDSSGIVVVDEAMWKRISQDKRIGIASLLRAYCISRSPKLLHRLSIEGDDTHAVLLRIEIADNEKK